jgi:hypothetical protein
VIQLFLDSANPLQADEWIAVSSLLVWWHIPVTGSHMLSLACNLKYLWLADRSRGEKSKTSAMEVQARVTAKNTENIRELPPVLMMED